MLKPVFWFFLLLSLCFEISWTQINKQYLPPPVQNLPLKGSNYNLQENIKQPRVFKEKNYGNSGYEVLEIQDHFEPSTGTSKNYQESLTSQANFVNNQFLNLHRTSDKPITDKLVSAPSKLPPDNSDLDLSLLSFTTSNDGSKQYEAKYSPPEDSLYTFKGLDILSPQSQKEKYYSNAAQNSLKSQVHQTSAQPGTYFSRSDSISSQKELGFKSPDYFPTKQHATLWSEQNTGFKETDYQFTSDQLKQNFRPNIDTQNLYLWSAHHKNVNQNTPTHQITSEEHENMSFRPKQQSEAPDETNSNSAFKGYDYYQSTEDNARQHVQPILRLPSGYDFQKPANAEQAIAELHKIPEELLPVKIGTLSSGYNYQKEEKPLSILDKQGSRAFKYSLPVYNLKNIDKLNESSQHIRSESESMSSSAAANFKHYYGFLKPEHPEQIINQYNTTYKGESDKTLNSQQKITQSPLQPFKVPEYLTVNKETQTHNHLKYLPPDSGSANVQYSGYLQRNSDFQQYNEAKYFLPIVSKQRLFEPLKTPEYFLPVNVPQPTQVARTSLTNIQGFNSNKIHHLNSYLTNIEPNDSYGKRKQLPQHGLLPTKTVKLPIKSDSSFDSSPHNVLYNNETSNSESLSKSTQNENQNVTAGSQQTVQALEGSVSGNAWQLNSEGKLSADLRDSRSTKASDAKIRTLQIFNPESFKTLKVLESSDLNGIKTIKIVDLSNQQPMGDHRIIKVVNDNQDQSVQTLKILNGRHDATHNANFTDTVALTNYYLSLRNTRDTKNKAKGKEARIDI